VYVITYLCSSSHATQGHHSHRSTGNNFTLPVFCWQKLT